MVNLKNKSYEIHNVSKLQNISDQINYISLIIKDKYLYSFNKPIRKPISFKQLILNIMGNNNDKIILKLSKRNLGLILEVTGLSKPYILYTLNSLTRSELIQMYGEYVTINYRDTKPKIIFKIENLTRGL